jgi:hypothetical protein
MFFIILFVCLFFFPSSFFWTFFLLYSVDNTASLGDAGILIMCKDEPPDRMKELADPRITFIQGDPTNRLDLDKCFIEVASMHRLDKKIYKMILKSYYFLMHLYCSSILKFEQYKAILKKKKMIEKKILFFEALVLLVNTRGRGWCDDHCPRCITPYLYFMTNIYTLNLFIDVLLTSFFVGKIIILSNPYFSDDDREGADAATIMTHLDVHKLAPKAQIFTELVHEPNLKFFRKDQVLGIHPAKKKRILFSVPLPHPPPPSLFFLWFGLGVLGFWFLT